MPASAPGARTWPGDWAGLAADWGYADQAHLIREFRAMAGVTPADYARDAAGRFRAVSAGAR
jgi:AraC-like DNA-binding protein